MNKFSKFKYEAGVDEAERKPSRTIITAAVILKEGFKNSELNDSKNYLQKKN